MPRGVYVRTEKDIQRICELNKRPKTPRQIEHSRRIGKAPRTEKQREASRNNIQKINLNNIGKPNPHKATVFADTIVEHHNDYQHGALRPNDISFMSHSEHSRLHANLRVKNGTHNFQN